MSLSLDDVRRIAHLARIEITDEQTHATLAQLNDIFAMIERCSGSTRRAWSQWPTRWAACSDCARIRWSTEIDRDEHLKNAPAQQDGLFLVPRVIE
jgi:aspartyl-tRNA(Asn)/glutamyl-tRNA(Gln) amidotransferase subunit C